MELVFSFGTLEEVLLQTLLLLGSECGMVTWVRYYPGGKKRIEFFQSWNVNSSWRKMGNSRILVNSLEHYPETRDVRAKKKEFEIFNILILLPVSRSEQESKSFGRCKAPLKVETHLAIYYGIRMGFNMSEFADFLFGFTTIDFLNDDTKF